MDLKLVISGAQVGADIAGLRAAKACDIPTGGWMPKGFRTLHGPLDKSTIEEFGLEEMSSLGYPQRTEQNVKFADATIRLAYNWQSAGEKLTLKLIEKHHKPHFDVTIGRLPTPDYAFSSGMEGFLRGWSVEGMTLLAARSHALVVSQWLHEEEVTILNVAGNGDPTIENFVQWFLTLVFTNLQKTA